MKFLLFFLVKLVNNNREQTSTKEVFNNTKKRASVAIRVTKIIK